MFPLTPNLSISGEESANLFSNKLFAIVKEAWSSYPSPLGERLGEGVFFLAWTTTPWTLPSNLGLTVGPAIDYVLVKTFNPYTHLPINVILAEKLLGKYFKPEGENGDLDLYKEGDKVLPWRILAKFKGSELEECRYEQLLAFKANSPKNSG